MKLKYIDALRGLAILAVMMVHCGQRGSFDSLPPIAQSIILSGAYGVQLFFIASAFTLFLSLENRNPDERYPWVKFFARRFFRIAPMYYLGICYYLWQDGFGGRYWLGDEGGVTIANVLSNFSFLHGFNPYWMNSVVPGGWSIAVEMLFYAFVPIFFLKIKNTSDAFRFVIAALLIRVLFQLVLGRVTGLASDRLWEHFLNFYYPSQIPVFALGILLYYIIKEGYKITVSPLLTFIASLLLIAHLAGLHLLPNHFLFGTGFLLLAIALSKHEYKCVVNPFVVYVGKVSYSLYLIHFAVLFWMDKLGLVNFLDIEAASGALINYGLRFIILIIFSTAIASVFFRIVELPMMRIGKVIISRIDTMHFGEMRSQSPDLKVVDSQPSKPTVAQKLITEAPMEAKSTHI
jgi:peptidoglycan/LPS O-acetylase OafA/YrhL